MSEQQTDPVIQSLRVRDVLDVARIWLSIGDSGPVRLLETLNPDEVLRILQAGEAVEWNGWTIRSKLPRKAESCAERFDGTHGVSAVSHKGFASGPSIDIHSVQKVCLLMREAEARLMAAHAAGLGLSVNVEEDTDDD